jgi:hypothetical protein
MESVSISGPAIAVSNSNLYWGRLTSGAMERPFHGRLSIGSLTAKSAEGTALRCRHAMIALANSRFDISDFAQRQHGGIDKWSVNIRCAIVSGFESSDKRVVAAACPLEIR